MSELNCRIVKEWEIDNNHEWNITLCFNEEHYFIKDFVNRVHIIINSSNDEEALQEAKIYLIEMQLDGWKMKDIPSLRLIASWKVDKIYDAITLFKADEQEIKNYYIREYYEDLFMIEAKNDEEAIMIAKIHCFGLIAEGYNVEREILT